MTDEMTMFGLGALQSPPDPRDFQHAAATTPASLARRLVLSGMGPVLQQGSHPWCEAFATAGMKTWQEKRDGRGVVTYDEAWYYALLKSRDGIAGEGSDGRTSMKCLAQVGYRESGAPGSEAHNRIATYWAVPVTVAAIKNAIASTGPVLVGGEWFYSWFHPVKGVLRPAAGGVAGGHATLVFGWDDDVAGGSLLVRNSWGADWPGSTNGNVYAPYARFVPVLWEAWAATDIVGDR